MTDTYTNQVDGSKKRHFDMASAIIDEAAAPKKKKRYFLNNAMSSYGVSVG